MVRRPSVLAVTSEVPWPLNSGGHLRTFHLLRTLAQRFDVRLVVPTRGGDEAGRAALEACRDQRCGWCRCRRARGCLKRSRSAARRPGASRTCMFARHRRRAVARALAAEAGARRPDVLYLDHLDSLVYAGAVPDVPIVIDLHNVYSRLAARAADEVPGRLRRLYLTREARLLARRELRRRTQGAHDHGRVGRRRRATFPRSGRHASSSCRTASTARPMRARPTARPGPPTILYVGALDWPPNASAARLLATEVLAAVRQRVPDARVTIVGKNPPPEVLALAQRSRTSKSPATCATSCRTSGAPTCSRCRSKRAAARG